MNITGPDVIALRIGPGGHHVAIHTAGQALSQNEILEVVRIAARENLDEVFRVDDYWQAKAHGAAYNFRIEIR